MLANRLNHHNIKITHKGLILALVPPLLWLVVVGFLLYLLNESQLEVQREAKEAEILHCATMLSQLVFEAGTTMTTFGLTRQTVYLDRYEETVTQADLNLKRLRTLVKGRRNQSRILEQLAKAESEILARFNELRADRYNSDYTARLVGIWKLKEEVHELSKPYNVALVAFRNAELARSKAGPQHDSHRYRTLLHLFVISCALAAILVAVALVIFYSRSITARLDVVTDNFLRLAANQPLHPVVSGSDEIAQLDLLFHEMAGILTEAIQQERATIDNAMDVICSIDQNNKFVEVNPATSNVWGYAPDELIGRRLVDIIVDGDIEKSLSALQEAAQSGNNIAAENQVTRKDGTIVDMRWAIRWSGEQKNYFCVAHDITDRKAAQNLLIQNEVRTKIIVESMPVALIVADEDGLIESTNLRAEQMFGYRNHEIANQNLKSLFKNLPQDLLQNNGDIVKNRLIGRVSELEARRKDGSFFPGEFCSTNISYRNIPKLLSIVLDVTERHEMERWKQDFIKMVSHDLRTPLHAIKETLSQLPSGTYGKLNSKGLKTIERCDSDLSRLTALIDDLLDLEKLQAGRMKLEFAEVDLSSVVAQAVSAVKFVADKEHIKIAASQKDLKGFADGPRLVQVIVNLVANAIKFSPPSSTVKIEYEETPGFIEVKVVDEGRGIPADKKAQIFERFTQVDSADHHVKGGKGLGLYICKSIVEAHGGLIGVESEEGKGSAFWFRVPQVKTGAHE